MSMHGQGVPGERCSPGAVSAKRTAMLGAGLLAVMGALMAPRAPAADLLYVGGSVGSAHESFDASTFAVGSSGTGYEISVGTKPLPVLAGEIDYVGFPRAFGGINFADTYGVGADALAFLPLPFIHLFGKVGLLRWHTRAHSPNLTFSRSGVGLDYGVGAGTEWGSLGARIEFERFDVAHAHTMQLASIGLTWSLL